MRARVLNRYFVMCRQERVAVELSAEGREETARVAVYVGARKLGERDVALLPERRARLEFPYRHPFSPWPTYAWVRVLADGKVAGEATVPVLPFELWVPLAAAGSLAASYLLAPLAQSAQRLAPQQAPLLAQLLQLVGTLHTLSIFFVLLPLVECAAARWAGREEREEGERGQEAGRGRGRS